MVVSRISSAVTSVVLVVSAFALWNAHAADVPLGIGRAASSQEINANSVTVLPDGTGLLPGRGTAKQGAAVYARQCAACHGDRGEGRSNFPALAGGIGSLAGDRPVITVGSYWPYATTGWDYINRAMPYQNPGTLRTDDVYAVTAYVLFLNGIVRKSDVLDRVSLPHIRMPNRQGFVDGQQADIGSHTYPVAPAKVSKPTD